MREGKRAEECTCADMTDVIGTSSTGTVSGRQSLRRAGNVAPWHYALVSALFTAAYLGLEWLTRVHELEALGITLWNPVKALCLGLLLIEGLAYAPMLFLAALLADLLIYGAAKTPTSMVATSTVVALGYAALAAILLRGFGTAL